MIEFWDKMIPVRDAFFQLASFKEYIDEFKKMHCVVFENVKRKKKQGEEKKEHSVILLKHLFGFVYNLIKYDFFFQIVHHYPLPFS